MALTFLYSMDMSSWEGCCPPLPVGAGVVAKKFVRSRQGEGIPVYVNHKVFRHVPVLRDSNYFNTLMYLGLNL